VISTRPAHPALVSEGDFIAVQGIRAERDNTGTATARRYLLRCGICGRRMESCWANDRPAYRCRHGYTSAVSPYPARPKNTYVREDSIPPYLPALHARLTATEPVVGRRRRRTRRGIDIPRTVSEADVISDLRGHPPSLERPPANRPWRTADLHPAG
jgi:site-specific DNA recombinase